MAMFTQQGQPTVAALKSAGTRQQVVPTVQQGATQIAPTGAPVTAVTSEAAKGTALKKEKSGTITFEDGSVYTGQLKKGEPNGQGTLIYSDTSTYTGQFKNGKPQGTGRFEDADGTVFDGQFDDGDFVQPEGEADAVQEPSPAEVPVRQRTKGGSEVRKGDTEGGKAPAKGQVLKAKEKVAAEPTEPTEPTPPKGGKKTLKKEPKKTEAKAEAAPKAAKLQKGPSGLAAMVGQLMGTTTQPTVVESQPKRGPNEASAETVAANEELDTAIETAETTKNAAAYAEALYDIVSAYVTSADRTYLRKTSTKFLTDEGGVPKGDYVAALREIALDEESISPKSRLYGLLADAGLLNDVNVMANVRVPGAKATQEAVVGEVVGANSEITPEERLANFIDSNPQWPNRKQLVDKLKQLYSKIDDDTFAVGKRGRIKDFFDADGNPLVTQPAGTSYFIPNTTAEEKTTKSDFVAKHESARKELRDLEDTEDQTTLDDLQFDPFYDRKPNSDDDWRAFRSDGKPLTPMKAGPLRPCHLQVRS
jgi:hypothetical protein